MKFCLACFRYFVLILIKYSARIFFNHKVYWVGQEACFKDIRVGALLNHTTLFEPIYAVCLPHGFLWRLAREGSFCVAKETLDRPLAGAILKLLAANVIPITRERDASWDRFLSTPSSMILLAPEGRMKRPNGLDKNGKAMTVRGGIVDVLCRVESGHMLLGYSAGLHHVQAPGDLFLKPFNTIAICFEKIEIKDYLNTFRKEDNTIDRKAIVKDLEYRRDMCAPILYPIRKENKSYVQ
jgi:hypothetical protein